MLIKKMKATFGRLNGDELELEPGMNIINAPNESGKSTWCAFIRTMLYGVNSAERDKSGKPADKTKYRPWNGSPMQGYMEIEFQGKDITLIRKPRPNALPGDCEAFFTATGEPCAELCGKAPGEILIGVPESVFRRSAFISRPAIAIDADSELEKRISALVSSGDEEKSYSASDTYLAKLLRTKKNLELAAIQDRLLEIETAQRRLEAENLRNAELLNRKEKLESDISTLRFVLEAHRDAEIHSLKKRLHALRDEEAKLRDEYIKLADTLSAAGKLPTLEDVRLLEASFKELENTRILEETSRITAENVEIKLNEARDDAIDPPKRSLYGVLVALAGVVLAYSDRYINMPYLWVFGAVLVLFAVFIMIYEARNAKSVTIEQKTRIKTLEFELKLAEEHYKQASFAYNEAKRKAKSYLSYIDPKARLSDYEALLAQWREDIIRLDYINGLYQSAKINADALEPLIPDSQNMDFMHADFKSPVLTGMSQSETKALLSQYEAELEKVTESLNLALGEQKHLGDPLVLSSESDYLNTEMHRLETEITAIQTARDVLSDASSDMRSRFAPIIGKKAASFLNKLTLGRYNEVFFDKTMSFQTAYSDDPTPREPAFLSDGTSDQLYLAARLAVSILALPSSEPPPLILDDVLALFDDIRTQAALNLFRELSKERQIILFSCRDREV